MRGISGGDKVFTRIDVERAKNRQMTIKELSEKSGIKYAALLDKLNGKTEFTRSEMLKIQSVFPEKISLEDLFCDSDHRDSA
jgi:hypothetical protein